MNLKLFIINCSLLIVHCSLFAGPPFNTDDPEPVNFRHWECYFATSNIFTHGFSTGNLPLLDLNYGILPDVQLTCVIPANYDYSHGSEDINQKSFDYGYAYTEICIKYRFIKEDENTPQVAVFPTIDIPTVNNDEFSNGKAQVYLPIWLQKSWGKFTTFGGGGYWLNPGKGNKNWLYAGWEAQYDISKTFTLGGEIIYESANTTSSTSLVGISPGGFFGINAGGFINFSDKFHFIYTAGHSLFLGNATILYVGILLTI